MKFVVALSLCVSLCLCLSLTRASVIAAPIPALPPVTIACCPSSMSLLQGNGGCFGGALPAAMPRLTTRPGPRKKVRIRGARPRVVILSKQPRPYRLPYPALISFFSSPRGLYQQAPVCGLRQPASVCALGGARTPRFDQVAIAVEFMRAAVCRFLRSSGLGTGMPGLCPCRRSENTAQYWFCFD